MQVRKGTFGRAGQVKWTHLSAEDTSRKRDDAYGTDPSLRDKCALATPLAAFAHAALASRSSHMC